MELSPLDTGVEKTLLGGLYLPHCIKFSYRSPGSRLSVFLFPLCQNRMNCGLLIDTCVAIRVLINFIDDYETILHTQNEMLLLFLILDVLLKLNLSEI